MKPYVQHPGVGKRSLLLQVFHIENYSPTKAPKEMLLQYSITGGFGGLGTISDTPGHFQQISVHFWTQLHYQRKKCIKTLLK